MELLQGLSAAIDNDFAYLLRGRTGHCEKCSSGGGDTIHHDAPTRFIIGRIKAH